MVARINTSKDISKALNYNEQKIRQGAASLLEGENFLKEVHEMNFYEKLEGFRQWMSLNERAITNTLHVSLNFDPSEKISDQLMISVAKEYMEQIGFGEQPYLVYRHHDSGHPHLHIVSTNIKSDGSRISMHNLGRTKSESARKAIEIQFQLVKAGDKKRLQESNITPVTAQKIRYGKSQTRRAIANVLSVVLSQYKCSSIHELNAVLKAYNVVADSGEDGSCLKRNNGLLYRILDERGKKLGVPIKASILPGKPTLQNLEKKFKKDGIEKLPFAGRVTSAINWVLAGKPSDLEEFSKALEKEQVTVVLRISKEKNVYGITYIDHKTKCVFNGSMLGKLFSARGIQNKMGSDRVANSDDTRDLRVPSMRAEASLSFNIPAMPEPLKSADPIPYGLRKKKKKRRRPNRHL